MSQRLPPDWATTPELIWQSRLYGYKLDFDAAYAAMGLYLACALLHTILTVKSPSARRLWWIWLPVLTGVGEAVGYYYRVLSSNHVYMTPQGYPSAPLGEIICTFVLLLVPPIILAVVNYEVIGKVMRVAGLRIGCLTHNRVTKTFLSLDILCFLFQCGAAPLLMDNSASKREIGSQIVLAGLVLQFVVFAGFVAISLIVVRAPLIQASGNVVLKAVRICLITIFTLLVRNGYRLYEYSKNYYDNHEHPTSFPVNHEWEFYIFEFVPVFAVHLTFAIFNFGWLLPDDAALALLLKVSPAPPAAAAATVAPGATAPACDVVAATSAAASEGSTAASTDASPPVQQEPAQAQEQAQGADKDKTAAAAAPVAEAV